MIPKVFHRIHQFQFILEQIFPTPLYQLSNVKIWLDSILDKIANFDLEFLQFDVLLDSIFIDWPLFFLKNLILNYLLVV